VFGDDVTTAQYVSNGADLETGGPNIHDHDRAGTSPFDVNAARMGEQILLNRRIAIRNLSTVPEELGHRKVCACWVPKRLTEG